MPIKINGATSGSTTITAPATGGDESIELSTALASKLPYSYGTATPSTTDSGFLWYDSNTVPALAKVWTGSAFVPFTGQYVNVASTQAFTGFTKGNATVTSQYARIGEFVHFWGKVVLGSTSSMSGPLDVTLPLTAVGGTGEFISNALFVDQNLSAYRAGWTLQIGTTVQRLVISNVGSTYPSNADISSTVPFTWTTNDQFYWNIFYKAA